MEHLNAIFALLDELGVPRKKPGHVVLAAAQNRPAPARSAQPARMAARRRRAAAAAAPFHNPGAQYFAKIDWTGKSGPRLPRLPDNGDATASQTFGEFDFGESPAVEDQDALASQTHVPKLYAPQGEAPPARHRTEQVGAIPALNGNRAESKLRAARAIPSAAEPDAAPALRREGPAAHEGTTAHERQTPVADFFAAVDWCGAAPPSAPAPEAAAPAAPAAAASGGRTADTLAHSRRTQPVNEVFGEADWGGREGFAPATKDLTPRASVDQAAAPAVPASTTMAAAAAVTPAPRSLATELKAKPVTQFFAEVAWNGKAVAVASSANGCGAQAAHQLQESAVAARESLESNSLQTGNVFGEMGWE